MGPVVSFVDTSVLCNLIPVPGRDQERRKVLEEYKVKAKSEALILPISSIIETGNHISHVANGHERRVAAETFTSMLRLTIAQEAPWKLHEFLWGRSLIEHLLMGANTGITLVEHAVNGFGCGDLCILCEKKTYMERTKIKNVQVWTKDKLLGSHA